LATSLRARFGGENYIGIELEVNQRLVFKRRSLAELKDKAARSLIHALKLLQPV